MDEDFHRICQSLMGRIGRDCKKRDCKTLFYIKQSVDSNNFERISKASTSKEAWEILVKYYTSGEKAKKVKLQMLRRQYELLQMEEDEVVADYFKCVQVVVNQMRTNGESLTEVVIIEKILRTLTQRYNHIVVTIEESNDLDKIKVEDLQGSFEAHELRVRERCVATSTSQVHALQTQVSKKTNQGDMRHKKGKGKFKWYKKYDYDEETDNFDEGAGNSRNQNKSDKSSKNSNGKKKFNKKGIQCYNCKKCGYFANKCKSK
ncbi:uncharacterized protein [Cicer arietinum]|uniref:uncharacterized protein n=1 Tax=Cicer arietinum TaxID=3827 RepID=UPI003CC642C3